MQLKGDLTTTALSVLLTELATESVSGCLHVIDSDGEEALVYLKTGLIYSVSAPGRRPSLGARLVSSGALAPEALAEALEAQRNELQGWRLGELLVHLGFVEQPVVEAFVVEQVRDSMSDLMRWTVGRWRFRKNEKAREDVAPAMPVDDLLAEVAWRHTQWREIAPTVHGPGAVPVLSSRAPASADITLDTDAWSLLCKVDNERALAELARECGFTLYEAGQIVFRLVQAGLLDVEEDLTVESSAPTAVDPFEAPAGQAAPAETAPYNSMSDITAAVASALAGPGIEAAPEAAFVEDEEPPAAVASRLISAFGGKAAAPEAVPESADAAPERAAAGSADDTDLGELARLITSVAYGKPETTEEIDTSALIPADIEPGSMANVDQAKPEAPLSQPDTDDPFAPSIARVSEALSDLLGPQQANYDPFEQGSRTPRKKAKSAEEKPKLPAEEVARRERIRAAAAAELSAAHATAEAERRRAAGLPVEDELATVTDLQSVRAEKVDAITREAREAAELLEVEAQAWTHHGLWLKATRISAEFDAYDADEQWVLERAAEIVAAEEDAWIEYEARLAAEIEAAYEEALAEYAVRLAAEIETAAEQGWSDHADWLAAQRADVVATAWAEHHVWLARERAAAEDEAWALQAAWLFEQLESVESDAWSEHIDWLAAERAAVEESARAEHEAWLADERAVAEEAGWAEYQLRLTDERAAVEPTAWAEHTNWLHAERASVEEQARTDHGVWLGLERASVEDAAWQEHFGRLVDERMDVEAEAWGEHAFWLEEEAAQAELEARVEYETRMAVEVADAEIEAWVQHEALIEAEAEAARLAAEEAEAEAARLAAEEAATAEEAEAARLAAEQAEAERLAAEQAEAERLAAEQFEAERHRRRAGRGRSHRRRAGQRPIASPPSRPRPRSSRPPLKPPRRSAWRQSTLKPYASPKMLRPHASPLKKRMRKPPGSLLSSPSSWRPQLLHRPPQQQRRSASLPSRPPPSRPPPSWPLRRRWPKRLPLRSAKSLPVRQPTPQLHTPPGSPPRRKKPHVWPAPSTRPPPTPPGSLQRRTKPRNLPRRPRRSRPQPRLPGFRPRRLPGFRPTRKCACCPRKLPGSARHRLRRRVSRRAAASTLRRWKTHWRPTRASATARLPHRCSPRCPRLLSTSRRPSSRKRSSTRKSASQHLRAACRSSTTPRACCVSCPHSASRTSPQADPPHRLLALRHPVRRVRPARTPATARASARGSSAARPSGLPRTASLPHALHPPTRDQSECHHRRRRGRQLRRTRTRTLGGRHPRRHPHRSRSLGT